MIAIEKIVLIVLFLIILIICIYILAGIIKPTGENLDVQNQIRQCCILYRAKGCPGDNTDTSQISDTFCSSNTNLKDLIDKVPMSVSQLKSFCGCTVVG